MSEPKPEWNIAEERQRVIDVMNQIAQAAGLPLENSEEDRVVITGPIWQAVVGDEGVSVAQIIRSVSPYPLQNTWPDLEAADIAAALEFAAYAVEASAVRMGMGKERPQAVVQTEEANCEPDLMTPPADLHIRMMAYGAGALMFALAVLVGWFLLQQLWGG